MTYPNAIIKSLFERKSVRVFEDRPISEDTTNWILDSAIQAPTAGNQVLYTILNIQDQAIKDELAESCDHQPFIAKAPLVLVFLADCRRWLESYRAAGVDAREPGLGDIILATADALIAAQNSVVAAESLGIGSCYIGDILENRERVVDLLGLDPYLLPAAMLVFGYPTTGQRARTKPARFDRRFVVMNDRYHPLSEADLREMFEEVHPGDDFDAYMTAFCKRKYMSEFAREMSRSAGAYLQAFGPGTPTDLL